MVSELILPFEVTNLFLIIDKEALESITAIDFNQPENPENAWVIAVDSDLPEDAPKDTVEIEDKDWRRITAWGLLSFYCWFMPWGGTGLEEYVSFHGGLGDEVLGADDI